MRVTVPDTTASSTVDDVLLSRRGDAACVSAESSDPQQSGSQGTVTDGLDQLRAERDAAVAALAHMEHRAQRRGRTRRIGVALLVLLFAILVPVTVTATWAHRTVLDTDTYVSTIGPIASDPAVTAAVGQQITNQIYAALDPEPRIAEVLPPRAAFLAGPIANGARDAIRRAVDKVLTSEQFQNLWVGANRFAHAQIVKVLRGDSEVLQTTNGQVVLNLVPLVNAAVQNAEDFISGVVGKTVTLPNVTGDELPSAACAKISSALGRPLPETCGQIPLFPADKLTNAQRAVRAFDRLVLLLLIVTPLVAVAAVWLSRRRRRTLMQLAIAGMLGLVIVRRTVMWLQDELTSGAKPENRAALSAIVHQVMGGFFTISGWVLFAGLLIVVVTLIAGPYRWAVATRHGAVVGARKTGRVLYSAGAAAVGRARDDTTTAWIRGHLDLLRVAGIAVALLVILFAGVNVWWFLVILVLLGLYELWLYRLRPHAGHT